MNITVATPQKTLGGRAAARTRLAAELGTREACEAHTRWRAYARWCDANDQPRYPAERGADGEAMLLRYVHAHWLGRGWRGRNVKIQGGHVARTFVAAGYPDPRGARWRGYLNAAMKQRPGKQPRVVGFTEDQVMAVLEAVATFAAEPQHLQCAVVVALCDLLDLGSPSSSGEARRVPTAAVKVRAADLILEHEGRRVLVDRVRQPHHYRVLASAVARTQPGAASICAALTPGEELVRWPWRSLRDRVRGAWWRLTRPSESVTGVVVPQEWWQTSTPRDREWLVRYAEDPNLERSRQDCAYFFGGLCFGGRYNEMKELRFRHLVTEDDEGFLLRLEANEHKGGRIAQSKGGRGQALDVQIPHVLADGGTLHTAQCPACIFAQHLEVRRLRTGGQSGDRVFVGLRSQETLNRKTATDIVKRLWSRVEHLAAEPGVEHRVGTRSIRITTATLARLKGLTLGEIADLLGHHLWSTTIGYIEQHDDHAGGDLVLAVALSDDGPHRA